MSCPTAIPPHAAVRISGRADFCSVNQEPLRGFGISYQRYGGMDLKKYLDLTGLRTVMDNIQQGLAGKQDKLTGSPGQLVGFGGDGLDAVTVTAGRNIECTRDGSDLTINAVIKSPNLLDNWYFANPINQRGQAEYCQYNGYTVDRWRLEFLGEGSKIRIASTGIELIPANGGWVLLGQLLEAFGGISGPVTLSFLADSQLVSATFQQDSNQAYLYHSAAIGDYIIGATGRDVTRISILYKGAAPVLLQAAKLELGSAQTLAHQDASGSWVLNDPPPSPAVELSKCQRYQLLLPPAEIIGIGKIEAGGIVHGIIPVPTTMRANPIAAFDSGTIGFCCEGQHVACKELDCMNIGAAAVNIRAVLDAASIDPYVGKLGILTLAPGSQLILDANL